MLVWISLVLVTAWAFGASYFIVTRA